jgi:PAS domain S-box-containing protein
VRLIAGRPAAAVGKDVRAWRELIHPDDRPAWDRAWEQRRAGETAEAEYRVVWPDGSVRWVRDSARANRRTAGRTLRLYGVFTDVTDRKQAAEPLQRLAALVETADDAIIGQTLDGVIVAWNRGAERLYGYARAEVRDQPVLRLFPPDGAKAYAEAVQKLRRGEHVEPYRTAQLHKNGDRVNVSMRVSPVNNARGELDGISIIARGLNGHPPANGAEPQPAPAQPEA